MSLTDSPSVPEAVLGVYAPPAAVFVRGCGSWLIDAEGRMPTEWLLDGVEYRLRVDA